MNDRLLALWNRMRTDRRIIAVLLFLYLSAGFYNIFKTVKMYDAGNPLVDFNIYRKAVSVAQAGGNPYEPLDIGEGFIYPPASLPVFRLITLFGNGLSGGAVWLSVLLFAGFFIFRAAADLYQKKGNGALISGGLMLCSVVLFDNLFWGQINMIVLLGLFLMLRYENEKPWLAGLGLALGISLKLSPLVFLGYLVARKSYREAGYTLLFTGGFAALSILLFGMKPMLAWPGAFRFIMTQFPMGYGPQSFVARFIVPDQWYFIKAVSFLPGAMRESLTQLFLKWQADPSGVHRGLQAFLGICWLGSAAITFFRKGAKEYFFIVTMILMVFSANILWYHHYLLLFLPFMILFFRSGVPVTLVLLACLWMFFIQAERFIVPFGILTHLCAYTMLLMLLRQQWKESRA